MTLQEAAYFVVLGRLVARRTYHSGYNKRWRIKNPERIQEIDRKQNKRRHEPGEVEKTRAYQNNYVLSRYHKDPAFRLGMNLRRRIRLSLTKKNKSANTTELLGCPTVWLEVHLESQFKPGMTWENYGPVWHVDHIKPCTKFDLTDPEQQRICFHWTNLQPLFVGENIRKGNKYEQR